MQDLFADYRVVWAEETTLAANQWQKDSVRLSWTTQGQQSVDQTRPTRQHRQTMSVTLLPMEIKTFVVRLGLK